MSQNRLIVIAQRMAVAAAFPCQPEKHSSKAVFELTDADVGILFDCAAGVRPQAVGCHIPADVPYVQLCGQPVCRTQFSRTQLTRLFWTARSKIVALQNDPSIHRGSHGSSGASQLHYEVSSFLSFIRHEVERVADSVSTRMHDRPTHSRDTDWLGPRELCCCLLEELRLTLRLTGRFSDVPLDKNHCRSSDNRRFHVALEAWWTALRVADIVMSSHLLRGAEISFCDLGGFGQNALFAQVAVLFLADLCCLSSRFFQSRAALPQESERAFPCACVRDAWAMAADLIGRRHEHFAEEAFWTYVNFVLEVVCPQSSRDLELDLNGFCLSSFSVSLEESDQAAFCLWMLGAIAEASKDSLWSTKGKNNYATAQKFVMAVTAEPKEALMRVVVRSCMSLHRVWEPSIDLLQSLLDFFLKNLNENFLTGSSGVQAFQVICQTSQQMHVRARALVDINDLGARGAENSYELFLMLLAHSLHRQSPEGVTSAWKSLRGRWQHGQKEALMRVVVRSCMSLHRVWEPSIDLLQSLLDFFLKNLNENFLTGSSGVQAFQVICQTSQQMHVRARALVDINDLGARGAENSYELFLMLLAHSLHRQSPEGVTSAWKSLRGRICSRFHAKRVEELTELGLQNCSLLFLVLALSIDLEEPVERLLSVLALVPVDSPVEKLRVALRSLFAVLLLLQASSADLAKVAAEDGRVVLRALRSGNATIQSLRSLLLPVYTDGIRELMDASSQLDCSEHALLVPEMALLLDQCSTSQQEDVLGTIHEVAEKLRIVHKRVLSRNLDRTDGDRKLLAQHKGFSDAIFKSTLQFLHKALAQPVQAASPATCFTDLAVNLTLLALDLPSSQAVPVKANFSSLFEHFGYSPHTHPSASGRFLCLVLEDGQACSELEARVTNSDPRLVQAWLRCCIGVKPPNSEMTRLSRIVLGRKEFANYNSLVGTMVPSDEVTAHDDLVVYFLDCLAQYADIVSAMDGISSLSQLRQSVACYLRDFVAVATAQLRNSAAAAATRDSLGNVYHLCGQLFRLCAGLIYTRGMADCVLPRLLDSLILPGALYAGKLIPQAQLAAIKQHLPLFICGLLSLNPQTDAYIERKLKDIVVHYLPLFPTQTQSSIHHTGEHPLLATLESCGGACRAAAERRAAYVGFLLDFIQKHFVAKKSVSGTHLNQALRFLLELLKHLAPLKKDCRSVLQSGLPNLLKSLGMLSGDARTNRELMSQVMRAVTMFSSAMAVPR
ncbi:protein MMS22-like [Dermacentor silvarum]|uniref:protein MMS22-like n=1 Tax=Dermacentor silvarum TaxID=543639 RepID=UPI002100F072|nr:protein MMS22-like [Dermacentor silvarum]